MRCLNFALLGLLALPVVACGSSNPSSEGGEGGKSSASAKGGSSSSSGGGSSGLAVHSAVGGGENLTGAGGTSVGAGGDSSQTTGGTSATSQSSSKPYLVVGPTIKISTVGYGTKGPKLATVREQPIGTKFRLVKSDAVDSVVFEGDLGAAINQTDSKESLQIADFSDFEIPGSYQIVIEGVDSSPVFRIADDAYAEPLRVAMLGFYGLRCGMEVAFDHGSDHFAHAACHTSDIEPDVAYGSTQVARDIKGGWHDAGDYGRYTNNGAFALAFVLKAWEDFGSALDSVHHIPNYEGTLPQWLDEAKYQMDWLLKMPLADGSVPHLIRPKSFPGMIIPESDTSVYFYTPVSPVATADFAAIAAMAARVFAPLDANYSKRCLEAAKLSQAYLDAHPDMVAVAPASAKTAYESTDQDDRLWAKVELWRATGEDSYLAAAEADLVAQKAVGTVWDWASLENLAIFDYLDAKDSKANSAIVSALASATTAAADRIVTAASRHAYSRAIGQTYEWGMNGSQARAVLNLMVANRVAPKAEYVTVAREQLDYFFGRNPFGRSLVTGIGQDPPMHPHHRPSEGDTIVAPWPGLLVGGANPSAKSRSAELSIADVPNALTWVDKTAHYYSNEVAINWNGPLVYALAAFMK